MSDLCVLCKGSGNLWIRFKYWDCRYCGGSGVMVQYNPAMWSEKKND